MYLGHLLCWYCATWSEIMAPAHDLAMRFASWKLPIEQWNCMLGLKICQIACEGSLHRSRHLSLLNRTSKRWLDFRALFLFLMNMWEKEKRKVRREGVEGGVVVDIHQGSWWAASALILPQQVSFLRKMMGCCYSDPWTLQMFLIDAQTLRCFVVRCQNIMSCERSTSTWWWGLPAYLASGSAFLLQGLPAKTQNGTQHIAWQK